jgi:threonine dehydrogenase-like Zn-dependent dehydrogenase
MRSIVRICAQLRGHVQPSSFMRSLLALTDVMSTGYHAAMTAEVRPGATARAYIPELLPDVLEGRIEPGRVFDRVASLDEVPEG